MDFFEEPEFESEPELWMPHPNELDRLKNAVHAHGLAIAQLRAETHRNTHNVRIALMCIVLLSFACFVANVVNLFQ